MILLGFVTQGIKAQQTYVKFGLGMDYLAGIYEDSEVLTRIDLDVMLLHFDYAFSGYQTFYDKGTLYKWNIGVAIPIGSKYQLIPKAGMMTNGQVASHNNSYFSHGIDFVALTSTMIYFDIGYNGVAREGNYMPGVTFSVGLYLPKFKSWERKQ